jgi:prolipoprotein diacylglyceryltransferase
VDPIDRVNQILDALPRTRVFRRGREAPAFRSCGVVGFYLAVVVTLATGLARERSLAVLAALAAVCGLSFFAYALARRRITGTERLVLLEQVWFALACSTGALLVSGEPPLGYLDAVVCGLAFFLAAGRLGCSMVGCCHGFPSSIGFRYGPGHVRDGLPAPWAGVRLFPVQLIELAALVAIGSGSVLFALLGPDGAALCFFLTSYGVIRFGLEGLRADERPHLLGVSQARWMAVAELATAIALTERFRVHPWALALLGLWAAAWLIRSARVSRWGLVPRALRPDHLSALRDAAASAPPPPSAAVRSALGFRVAASPTPRGYVVSLSGPGNHVDLPLLCQLAASAFPELDLATALLGGEGVLIFEVPSPLRGAAPAPHPDLGRQLHAGIARASHPTPTAATAASTPDTQPSAPSATTPLRPVRLTGPVDSAARASYFAPRSTPGALRGAQREPEA